MSDHETTLRKIADDIAENLATYPKHSSQVPVLVREMENLTRERAACLAGAEALHDAKTVAEAVNYYTGEDVDVLVQRYRDDLPAMMPSPTEPPR